MDKVRRDIVGAIFGGIPASELNALEKKLLVQGGRNPGTVSALQSLSEVEGGLGALNRLISEQPGLDPEKIWDLFKAAGEDAARFRDTVVQYLDAHPPAALRAPQLTLANGQKAAIKELDEIYFTPAQAKKLEQLGIPYPKEFFLISGVGQKSDKGDGWITVVGSVGGRFSFSMDDAIVDRVRSR